VAAKGQIIGIETLQGTDAMLAYVADTAPASGGVLVKRPKPGQDLRVDMPAILGAIDLHRLHGFSFRDGLILRCAAIAGCRRLLTEDLQHDRTIEGVRIENPFLESDES